jgi:hypothetical protein
MTQRKIVTALALASGLLLLPQGGAEARIVCEGNYQIVDGRAISTPYCRDWELARVARTYGWRVTFQAIRFSESTRSQVCRAIGHDNRVNEACSPYRIDGGSRRIN